MATPRRDDELHPTLNVPWARMPRHVAIIMDGNGRWAQQRGLPRLEGHSRGSKAVRETVTESARLGLDALTLYSFSTENWRRPPEEIAGLMKLYDHYLINERPTLMEHSIRVVHLGSEERLPDFLLESLHETVELTSGNDGMALCLALNYSGRSEIIKAVRGLAGQAASGDLDPNTIDEQLISDHLYTAGLPDPDLLIRTSGERRISNFLLWQISYAELHVTDVHWPDFTSEVLHDAIVAFTQRNRRFGGIKPA